MSINRIVEVEINGEVKQLKYDFNAVCDLEEKFGKGVAKVFSEDHVGFSVIRVLYWAGLKWKNQGLTLQVVGDMLGKDITNNGKSISDFMGPVMEALRKSKIIGEMGEPGDSDGEEAAEKN